jgi:hypothetical protein
MGEDTLQLEIKQNKENINKALQKYEQLAEKYGADHDETIKQHEQINTLCSNFDILFDKIGRNGWSQKVTEGIDELRERITLGEKADIERKTEIALLNSKVDVVLDKLIELKNKPKERMSSLKDKVYVIVGFISIFGAIISVFTWMASQGGFNV